MPFVLVVFAGGLVAGVVGFLVRRWWLLPATMFIGVVAITVDVSTRDLASGGHDDTLVVAGVEAVVLAWIGVCLGSGLAVGKHRDSRSPSRRLDR